MAAKFPFQLNADLYSRQLWSKQVYMYLAEFFRTARFDQTVKANSEFTVDDYRYSGGDDSWRLPCSGGAGSDYKSYFRVIDASTYNEETGELQEAAVGVTSGAGIYTGGDCGAVKIGGARVSVEAIRSVLSAAGIYLVWIHSWLAVDGVYAEMRVGAVDDLDPPDNPNAGIVHASQLAGHVVVAAGEIVETVQHYLRGGEHTEIFAGRCKQQGPEPEPEPEPE